MPRFAKLCLCLWILNCLAHNGLVTAADIDPLSQFVASIHSYVNSVLQNGISNMTSRIGHGIVQIDRRTQCSSTRSLEHSTLSSGTGFIVDSDGLIITNIEVVAGEEFVNVTLNDGRRFRGQVFATNRSHDIAAVRINATNLPVVELGGSEELLVDQQLVAIGSSSAQTHAIEECNVRFPRRPARNFGILNAEKQDVEYIETTAATNRSFLGGPLVNLSGQVVGMNSMVPGFPHRGVAIPVTYVRNFYVRLQPYRANNCFNVNTRRWRRIGALMYSLTPEVVEQFRQRNPNFPLLSSGVYVQSVLPDTPAQMSGLLAGDIITHINGLPVRSEVDVMSILRRNQMLLALRVIRSGDVLCINVVAEDWLH